MQWVLCNSRYYDQDCQHTDSRLKALAVNSSQPSGWLWLYAGLIGTGSKHHKGDELPGNGPCLYKSFFLLMDVSGWMFLLVPAHPDSSRQRAIKQLYVYVSLYDILFSMCTQNGTCVTVAVNSVHCCWIMRWACVASCRTHSVSVFADRLSEQCWCHRGGQARQQRNIAASDTTEHCCRVMWVGDPVPDCWTSTLFHWTWQIRTQADLTVLIAADVTMVLFSELNSDNVFHCFTGTCLFNCLALAGDIVYSMQSIDWHRCMWGSDCTGCPVASLLCRM